MANGDDLPPDNQDTGTPQRPSSPWGRRTQPEDYGKPGETRRPNPLFGPRPEDEKPEPPPEKPKGPQDWMDNLEDMDPEDEQQALFYLGWMAGDVPPHVRAAARHEYSKKFGPLTSDDWKKWKEKMGYGDTA